MENTSSTRIKDAGIAIRHSRGYIISILQGPDTDLREWSRCVDTEKNRKPYQKGTFSLWTKKIEDAWQDEKHVPDLLEAIIQPPDPVKDELRQKLSKMTQIKSKITKIKSKITKIKVPTFWIPEIRSFRAAGQCQPSRQ